MDYAIHDHIHPRMAHFLRMAGGRRHHHRHGRGRHGGPPFGFPGSPGFPRGRRARRGDIRAALLVLLAEEPRNGYQLMQEIERRSDGVWRPSPGSVYPALQQLEDEGLVRREERDGQRLFHLTDAGQAHVDERPESESAPWDVLAAGIDEPAYALMDELRQIGMAASQLAQSGNEAQVATARGALAETRRALYRILAEPDAPEGS